MAAIEGSLHQILETMGDSGVLPIKQGEGAYQVNFFHGAPGAIPMLTQAAWAFPHMRDRLLDAASKAGDLTWNEGFIPQDNGLSNGCAGNGYALHCLFRTYELLSQHAEEPEQAQTYKTAGQKWRTRAYKFAKHIAEQKDMPQIDHPYSLMQGLSGEICFLSDLLRDENDVRFPSLEI